MYGSETPVGLLKSAPTSPVDSSWLKAMQLSIILSWLQALFVPAAATNRIS